MKTKLALALAAAASLCAAIAPSVNADTLRLKDGREVSNCFVRDEGIRLLVWNKLADVGTPNFTVYPRSQVKDFKVDRDDVWDKHPNLADLSVTFIEMNPKLAGLHGRVDYDEFGRPVLKGGPLPDFGDRSSLSPERITRGLKLKYQPGEEITLTAHVKNLGFASAKSFEYVWLMDGKELKRGEFSQSLKEMQETSFPLKWKWQDGQHSVTFKVITKQPELATINNETTDPLWGWGYTYVVSNGRVNAWHQARTAYGTFSFEDFYRWHVDIMNTLFAASVYPSAPEGIKARVRLDRIVYTDDVEKAAASLTSPDGIRCDQGGWVWQDDQDKNKKWEPATRQWRNSTEWSLPHELGHQLGLTDWYALDYAGDDQHVWPDNGEKITHFQNHPVQMMHWHGPQIYGEVDADYFNMTWDKPRGYFGDYYFAIPRENFLRIVDVNGVGVPDAKVEIYQRGAKVDPNSQPAEDQGVKYFSVVEDGNFDLPLSSDPVIVGSTDSDGIIRLPNRPVKEVRTLNGFYRQANPFGNINVVGNRGEMLVKVTRDSRPAFFWLEISDYNLAWFRDHKKYTTTLKTPYRSADSPLPPASVTVTPVDDKHVKVTWTPPTPVHEQQYLEKAIGYRVYRRYSSDCLNDRPWFPVATLGPNASEFIVDLTQLPEDTYWFSKTNRFAVSSIGELSKESELVEAPLLKTTK